MSNSVTCEHCSTTIVNKRNLERHQQTLKCLQKQKENETTIKSELEKYKNLVKHQQETIKDLKKTNSRLLEKATEPKIINNKIINNKIVNINPTYIMDLSQQRLNPIFKTLEAKNIRHGFQGLAKFAFDNIIKDSDERIGLLCSDINRGNFRMRDSNNNMIPDPKAIKFTETILPYSEQYIKKLLKKINPCKTYKDYTDPIKSESYKHFLKLVKQYNTLKREGTEKNYWKRLAELTYFDQNGRKNGKLVNNKNIIIEFEDDNKEIENIIIEFEVESKVESKEFKNNWQYLETIDEEDGNTDIYDQNNDIYDEIEYNWNRNNLDDWNTL